MVREAKYIIRFDPNGECKQVAIDFITHYFFDKLNHREIIASISTLEEIVSYIKDNGLKVYIKLPLVTFFSPFMWKFIFKFYNHVLFKNAFLYKQKDFLNHGIKHCILYGVTGNKLYNMQGQDWTHCVVKYVNVDGFYEIYDPLSEQIIPKINTEEIITKLEKTLSWSIIIK